MKKLARLILRALAVPLFALVLLGVGVDSLLAALLDWRLRFHSSYAAHREGEYS
jgi:hypothetical protein